MMIMAERKGRLHAMFLLAIVLLILAMTVISAPASPVLLYIGMWLFFVGFNYLEATLPSLVSKMVFAGGKGTALGIYSTCQFLGAFAGGALGGWLLKSGGASLLFGCCLGLSALWLVVFLPTNSLLGAPAAARGEQ